MVEFNRSENDRVGEVVQKFRALIEERGVVFVAFKNKVFAISQLKAAAEILGDAANQKGRLQTGLIENPCQH